jgi:hypothetical protein
MHRQSRYVLATLIVLAACTTATLTDRLSDEQASALAREVLRHTPEHTHFADSTKFDWVFFTPGKNSDYPEAFAAIRSALAGKYALYSTAEEMPDTAERHDGMGPSYVGGFLFSVAIRKVDATTIEVEYSDYEGTLAGGRQSVRYQWRGGRWVKVWESPQVVS